MTKTTAAANFPRFRGMFLPEEFGAKADGHTLNTESIQACIDACHEAGGGTVYCGAGDYLTGSIDLKSHVELHLSAGCRLLGSTTVADYRQLRSSGFKTELANENTALYLIGASHAERIAITGPGRVDGRGAEFYDSSQLKASGRFGVKPTDRPRILMLHKCSNVRIQDATFIDSACWTFWLLDCQGMAIRGITITSEFRLLNSDGIDFDGCRDVTMSDCRIDSEDDSIVIRAIQNVHEQPIVCENIVITNCILKSTHQCVRISCPNDTITRNCRFSNLLMSGRVGINIDLPHRFSSGDDSTAEVYDIDFSGITIHSRSSPIRIGIEEGIRGAAIHGLSFNDMRLHSESGSCRVKGNSETIVEDISFNNLTFNTSAANPFELEYCNNIRMNNVVLVGVAGGRTATRSS